MEADYKAVGLKCGLEVHQQLDTGKLFTRTPSILREDAPHYTLKRRLRPVASEMGEQDKAALEAFQKGLYYIYEGYNDTIGLVELDEEPPQPVDNEALETTLEVALLSDSRIIDEMCVMRKMVIDGSNTSGFQRTMLVASGGSIDIGSKRLGVQTIVLEEDAARPVEKGDGFVRYRLDRLGIPLIELATEPGIETAQQAKEAARAIGNLMRRTGKVKRGLGTIRQDLNVSIAGGARVEIKGVQELDIIDEYVRREVQRQQGLLAIKAELLRRNAPAGQQFKPKDLSATFEKSESKIIRGSLSRGDKILGQKLEGFAKLPGFELQPNRRLGTELADQVKTKTGLRGLFHSDELPNYGITEQEVEAVKAELGCLAQDAFIIVAGPVEKAQRAIKAAFERAQYCFAGVPEETRGAIEGGNNEYLRPLPGAARMYPETDVRPIEVEKKTIEKMRKELPLTVEQRLELYIKKYGLSEKLADEMKLSNYARFFEKMAHEGADARMLAVLLLEGLTELKREGVKVEDADEDFVRGIVDVYMKGIINKDILLEFVKECLASGENPNEAAIKFKKDAVSHKEIESRIDELIGKNKELVQAKGSMALGALMGDLMKEYKGKVSGKVLGDLLRKKLG
ncbi:MAG TPA: Glu-tRNA(Gln) amidotransferase subunit GatE [Candidatus Diapherotrites archaeon]|uniref:Glutamyl-tRNA(Gln) amidotransferase subunit E n=1 Tax=Candidatus Iainarchaeum sp. TaxID=3101447 RepID=A0A7J4IZA0_9ARCH|nr:Glu-tRNA(Gln) amidotransferase subunit GatE [Candidatus Diapherotrites archaeon]